VSTDPVQSANETGAGEPSGQPSEEELRAAYEAEIGRVTSTDMILQSVVSLLNVGGHRLGLSSQGGMTGDESSSRDLEQVRDAIDGARALMGILERREPENMRPLRDALSQLQMAYAREAGAGTPAAEHPARAAQAGAPAAPAPTAPKPSEPAGQGKPDGGEPGPAESSGRLWVPGR
jgi:Tfp pilus assembly protein FimV